MGLPRKRFRDPERSPCYLYCFLGVSFDDCCDTLLALGKASMLQKQTHPTFFCLGGVWFKRLWFKAPGNTGEAMMRQVSVGHLFRTDSAFSKHAPLVERHFLLPGTASSYGEVLELHIQIALSMAPWSQTGGAPDTQLCRCTYYRDLVDREPGEPASA
eukprot:3318603-Amphidinium_carterae.1